MQGPNQRVARKSALAVLTDGPPERHIGTMGEKRLSADGVMTAARRYARRQPPDDELAEGGTAAIPRGGILSGSAGNAAMTQLLGRGRLEAGPVAPPLLALQREL